MPSEWDQKLVGDINQRMQSKPRTERPPSVAIVVPVYREILSADEVLSLRHLDAYLSRYDRIFLSPAGIQQQRDGFRTMHFPEEFFRSTESYSQLLLSADFYRAFSAFEYLLIHQLDALVFSDQLSDWCRKGYDYVGAPWLIDENNPSLGFSRAGNGGFSLRRVETCLRVLEQERPSWIHLIRSPPPDFVPTRLRKRLTVARAARRGAADYISGYTLAEDRFWSDRASMFHPAFRVAPVEEALAFSFERAPRACFDRLGRLPFGCHAWSKWDRPFWEPYLLPGESRAGSAEGV